MSDFYSKLQATQNNVSVTENGAVGFKTTQSKLVDFNFAVSSYRNDKEAAKRDFKEVIKEGDKYVLKYLFYLRDIREGLGERDLFRIALEELVKSSFEGKDEVVTTIIKETPEFGRWDDLFIFLDTSYRKQVATFIHEQLKKDVEGYKADKSISLLAKWMPSENASSKETKRLAHILISEMGLSPKQYRTALSTLRKYLDVTEVKTCAKEWGDIDYNTVPSKANVKYSNAFLRNDESRRREFLSKLAAGDKSVKINSSVNFPHDVLHMYSQQNSWGYTMNVKAYDETIEQLWKNLKEVDGLKDTIVVRDDSGSMQSVVGNTSLTAYEVATALGIYCAQHNSEAYRNKIITFSETPRYLDFSDGRRCGSLHSIYKYLNEHSEVANTNVKAVFDLILKTAVENKLAKEDLPKQILILSDMEFDSATYCYRSSSRPDIALFNIIGAEYAKYGYELPKLVFWNLCSRTKTIPLTMNKNGVILISGFSQNVISLVNNGKTDPYEALVVELDKERYSGIPFIQFTKTSAVRKSRTKSSEKVDLIV